MARRKPHRSRGGGPEAREASPGAPLTSQGLRTRGALLRAARRAFERHGYRATRISDITDAAGVSVGTFYTYFTTKEDIFRQLLISVEDEVYGELATDRSTVGSPRKRIQETNRLALESYQRNARFWAAVEEAALSDAESRRMLTERRHYYWARTHRGLTRWQEQGLIGEGVDIDFSAMALGAMTERCAHLWFVVDDGTDVVKAAEQLTTLWLRALGIPLEGEGEG